MLKIRHVSSLFFILGLSLLALTGCNKSKNEMGNTLHISSIAKFKGLDPILADDMYAGDDAGFTYEGLLQYSYLKRPYVLTNALAEAMPELSSDGKTYTFHLKKGVLFVDDPCFKETGGKGREMTSADFVYSWKRLADPKLNSSGWWVFDGRIAGLNEWHDASAKSGTSDYSAQISGLKTPDPYTLQITLNAPSAIFLYSLAMTFTSVVPHEAVDFYGKEFINHAVGTGPFKLEEFSAARTIWVRNPTFRKEVYPSEGAPGDKERGLLDDAGKQIPFVDRVIFQVFEEDQPRWLSFMSGKLDLAGIPKDNFSQAIDKDGKLATALSSKGIQLDKTPMLDITHVSFNMADPLIGKNKLLRQALSLAYDNKKYIDIFYNQQALSAQGPIPPGIKGYDPNAKSPYLTGDLEKAKELLAKAGYPGGKGLPALEVAGLTSTTDRQSNEFLAKAWEPLGVKLNVNAYSWPQFQDAVKNRKGQIWSFAWGADYPDAENFLQLFYSKNASPGPNDANYSNPEFDRLYEKALTLQDTPARTEIYQQMAKIVVEDCPWIFNAHRYVLSLTQAWLHNYKWNDVDHGKYKYLRVDLTQKK